VAQTVGGLLCKLKALSSHSSPTKKKERKAQVISKVSFTKYNFHSFGSQFSPLLFCPPWTLGTIRYGHYLKAMLNNYYMLIEMAMLTTLT
jgi:hypothetical protein